MKSPQAFRSIGEVARLVGVATHVLRYWETQFPALSPVRRPDGRRYYRPDDLLLAAGLCEVMRDEGLTIRGAQRLISLDKGAALRERGRLRLQATGDEQPQTATARERRANGREATASARSSKGNGATPAAGQQAETLPDGGPQQQGSPSDTPHQMNDDHAGASAPDGTWLERLVATAAALRSRAHPLPADSRSLLEALRAAHDPRD